MKYIWKQLPDDIVNEILSYGDPEVYKKFKLVMEKIETLKKEFQIARQESIWYRHPETHFLYYALRYHYHCLTHSSMMKMRDGKRTMERN